MTPHTLDATVARAIVETTPAIVLVLDAAGCIEYVNPAFETLTGKPLSDVLRQEWCSTCLPHRDRARVRSWIAGALDSDDARPLVSPIFARRGERTIEWQVRQTPDDLTRGVVCFGRDVTDSAPAGDVASALGPGPAPAEHARIASESGLRRAQQVGRIGSWEYDRQTAVLEWSDEMFRILELDPATVRPSKEAFSSRIHPDDGTLVDQAAALALQGRPPDCVLHRMLTPDGRVKWVENRWELEYDGAGVVSRILGTMQDVTARIDVEAKLGKTRNAYRQLDAIARMRARAIDVSLNAIAFADLSGRISYVNQAFAKLWGLGSDAEALGQPYTRFWPDAAQSAAALESLLSAGTWSGALRARRADGSEFHMLMSAAVIRDDSDLPYQLMASMVDVTERKRAEEEVRRSRDLLRAVIDSSPDSIFAKDDRHRFLLVNRAFAERRGSAADALLGRPDSDCWPDDLREAGRGKVTLRDDDLLVLSGKTVRRVLETGSKEDGTWRAFDSIKRPLRDAHGRAYGVLVYSRDTTEQHLAHAAQARALAEKETLLREIHHRVKNNLQIISSLLHFQSKKVSSPRDRMAFDDGRKRLLAMILVHEKLYQSRELSGIEFGLYARSLVAALMASFEEEARVRMEFSASDIRLPIDVALPVGLMLCELITNIFKYAFPGERQGRAAVSIRDENGQVVVDVQDDGIGLPPEFDPRAAQTFGWHLIMTLVAQLGARVDVHRDRGTLVRIVLPIPAAIMAPAVARPVVTPL